MKLHEKFNQNVFSKFINSGWGKTFRIVAGLCFLIVGYIYRDSFLGIASMIWSIFPLSAGIFDWCYISAVLGGPISGAKIRNNQSTPQQPVA
ncbi:MAG: hypothetical protein A3D35_00480 [Candidatus Staskawiczbacteria bacterium RIFCSPHIGHO2_02_FULL_34_9]|uniref:DUF2892 domain-containing protein n=1 Tax=Candidatus Staskawiczbacteria bacterium RIFCSPHIGHO2_02_FULL_34_9 TaxID=1802206 RepID=A0A1G2HZ27_9BACT|nr:MAG: hypothetical protein A3D35_00480 [Candidatus Staskawiczbacteria bacterium RIFCSPHIGHO2_02_FULL_34_9]